MAAGSRGYGDVVLNEQAIRELLESPAGPVGRVLTDVGQRVTKTAKRRAPVSPHGSHGRPSGWLRSQVGWALHHDVRGLYVDIASPARTADGRDAPYGLFQNIENLRGQGGHRIRTTPHLVPALLEEIANL